MGGIRVGKPDIRLDVSTHVPGIHEGNKGPYYKQPGHHEDGTSDARRSTGILWKKHNAIMKIMPNISPG
ncbi:hypothetical protein DFQ14_104231 [Halopolyspora algeriensis]|uniref:Uncharacterized protein n=1 Tax=Halopolyspora algeriensis TaxID=1500506 RepID=A0A368VRT1_9ACTN|nr:hypothetical protein [Halopolyspora algeriensis]RCW44642.1 hypothetical protein DFQ14_104231 [Halopolyspora algeriensis]TQM56003.1 hypothetical protein FHU43_0781 [Halopolyspora algeriensis]